MLGTKTNHPSEPLVSNTASKHRRHDHVSSLIFYAWYLCFALVYLFLFTYIVAQVSRLYCIAKSLLMGSESACKGLEILVVHIFPTLSGEFGRVCVYVGDGGVYLKYICIHICIMYYVCMYVRKFECLYVYMYVCIFIWNTVWKAST